MRHPLPRLLVASRLPLAMSCRGDATKAQDEVVLAPECAADVAAAETCSGKTEGGAKGAVDAVRSANAALIDNADTEPSMHALIKHRVTWSTLRSQNPQCQ